MPQGGLSLLLIGGGFFIGKRLAPKTPQGVILVP